jgi:hypothetical protein
MALQNAEKRHFRSEQNGHCDQPVTDVPGNFAHVFANKVPALLARKSRVPQGGRLKTSVYGDQKRLCVMIPNRATTWASVQNKEQVYVIPVGY